MNELNDDDEIAHASIWIAGEVSLVVIVGFVAGVVFGWLPIPFQA